MDSESRRTSHQARHLEMRETNKSFIIRFPPQIRHIRVARFFIVDIKQEICRSHHPLPIRASEELFEAFYPFFSIFICFFPLSRSVFDGEKMLVLSTMLTCRHDIRPASGSQYQVFLWILLAKQMVPFVSNFGCD